MTTRFRDPDSALTGYAPTEAELASLHDWFVRYDAHAADGELRRLADMADFPVNLVTDGDDGAWTGSWEREEFLSTMAKVMGDGSQATRFDSVRTPCFVTANLAVVFTDSTVSTDEASHRMRYADILVREAEGWRFQTMVQGGWADMLTGG